MQAKYPKGSEWGKWDLHVHTPCSELNNQFPTWDEYVKDLFTTAIEKDIACIGITDYFSIEGYKKLKTEYLCNKIKLETIFADELKSDPNYLQKISNILILPNIELRLDHIIEINKQDGKQETKKLEYHIILSNELSIEDIESNILSQLKFSSTSSVKHGTDSLPVTRFNIENLGKKLKSEQSEFAGESDYFVGCMNAAVSMDSLESVFKKANNLFFGKYIFALPIGDISKIDWRDSGHNIRKRCYAVSDFMFSSNAKTINWGLSEDCKEEFSSHKGCIWGSDAHKSDELFRPYSTRYCWIKSNPTFQGLLQAAVHPHNRIYIGEIPPTLDFYTKHKNQFIDEVIVKKNVNAGKLENWLDAQIQLNSGLVAIIGNKGSGKSALSDIIGYLCESSTMEYASFLCKERFQHPEKKYAADYSGTLKWGDGNVDEKTSFQNPITFSRIEKAKYLPQKYIETVCGDIGGVFQAEIDKTIFSYIDNSEKDAAENLKQLLERKFKRFEAPIESERKKLKEINKEIIIYEDYLEPTLLDEHNKKLAHLENELSRLDKNAPNVVLPPPTGLSESETAKLAEIEEEEKIVLANEAKYTNEQSLNIRCIEQIDYFISAAQQIERDVEELNEKYKKFLDAYNNSSIDNYLITITSSIDNLKILKNDTVNKKANLELILKPITTDDLDETLDFLKEKYPQESLDLRKIQLREEKKALLKEANEEQQKFQKYQSELQEWNLQKKSIIGDINTDNTIAYHKEKIRIIKEDAEKYLETLDTKRMDSIKRIHVLLNEQAKVLTEIYAPIQNELESILTLADDKIDFFADILANKQLNHDILSNIDKQIKSPFREITNATALIDELIKSTDFNSIESVCTFFNRLVSKLREGPSKKSDLMKNRESFYNFLSNLEYLSVEFTLKLGVKKINELSPGERGLVLLIFYLGLSKDNTPLIIDQPEDNLDNQSVYSKLVPCILEAKKHRQVIVVTHNPNIAIACDAEQIIHCTIDKSKTEIRYSSGSIENIETRKQVVDILEGTIPAFDLRKSKYFYDLTKYDL